MKFRLDIYAKLIVQWERPESTQNVYHISYLKSTEYKCLEFNQNVKQTIEPGKINKSVVHEQSPNSSKHD